MPLSVVAGTINELGVHPLLDDHRGHVSFSVETIGDDARSCTCSSVALVSKFREKYSRPPLYRMHGMSLSTLLVSVVCGCDVAVDVAVWLWPPVAVCIVVAISASGRERASVPCLSISPVCHPP